MAVPETFVERERHSHTMEIITIVAAAKAITTTERIEE